MISGLSTVSLLSIILARWIINVSLAIVLGYQLVYLFLTWHTQLPATQISTIATPATTAVTKSIDINQITAAHWFGIMPAVTETSVINAPETKLNLKLRGIYYSSDAHKSFVVIAETEGKHQLYRQGATVSNSVILQEILPKSIILNRNGRYETLKLTAPPSDNSAQATIQTGATQKNAVDENLTPAQLLSTYQQQLRENPQKLLSLIRLEPVEREGKFGGFRLSPGRDTTLFTRFNLKSGDVLVAVNGIDLDSPLKGLSLIEQLGQTNQLNLAILRNGQPISLSFSVDK